MEPSTIQTGTVIDRYTVEGLLGEGGNAAVFRVRHNTLGTLHALKVLKVGSQVIRERLRTEGRLQASVRHPNIVAVTDVLEHRGADALLMEYVDGPTLDAVVRSPGLTVAQVDALARGIFAGVGAAHAQGWVHRDLKPANILLEVTPAGLVPKVTDFGLAKAIRTEAGSNTRTGTTMGTAPYMSPEQIRDAKTVGVPADLFALGTILYEMLSGRRAFDGTDVYEIFNAVMAGTPPRLRDLVPELPERMERAIDRALALDPAQRPRNVEALAELWSAGAPPPAPVMSLQTSGRPAFDAAFVSSLAAPGDKTLPSGATAARRPSATVLALGFGSGLVALASMGFVLLAGVAALGVWGYARSGSGPTVAAIAARSTLRVAMDTGTPEWAGSPPMVFQGPAGAPDGLDVVLADEIARELGVGLQIVHGKYSELDGMLVDPTHPVDLVISGYIPTPTEGVRWSVPYLEFGLCLVVPSDAPIRTTDDLRGKAVGIFDDDAAAEEVDRLIHGYTELVRLEDGYWDQLLDGRFAGFLYDAPFAVAEINQWYARNPDRRGALRVAQYNLTDSHYAVGVRADEPDLAAAVDRVIARWRASDAYGLAVRRYLRGGTSIAPLQDAARTVIAGPGDSLSRIAERELGDKARWEELWERNRDRFAGPDLIEPGDRVVLP